MELRIFGKHVAEDDFLHQFLTEVKEEGQVWGFVGGGGVEGRRKLE